MEAPAGIRSATATAVVRAPAPSLWGAATGWRRPPHLAPHAGHLPAACARCAWPTRRRWRGLAPLAIVRALHRAATGADRTRGFRRSGLGLAALPEELQPPEGFFTAFGIVGLAWALLAAVTLLFDAAQKPGYKKPGKEVTRVALQGGGSLQVTAHRDGAAPEGAPEEWRALRFEPCLDYLQAVTKVRLSADDSATITLRPEQLPLPYNQSLVAVTLATLQALGTPVLEAAKASTAEDEAPLVRILCIGLGGGSVPSFFAHMLPRCSVDVAELEPAVLTAASEAMGFRTSSRLRVDIADGAEFASRSVTERSQRYDAIVIDAFDAEGNVPEVMWEPGGGIAEALAKGVLREPGVLAVNFLPYTDVAPRLSTYSAALARSGASPGLGFSVLALEGNLMTAQTCGGPAATIPLESWQQDLARAGRSVAAVIKCPFDLAGLASCNVEIWR